MVIHEGPNSVTAIVYYLCQIRHNLTTYRSGAASSISEAETAALAHNSQKKKQ